MQVRRNIRYFNSDLSSSRLWRLVQVVAFLFLCSDFSQAIPLSDHIKRFTSVLSHRNLDSLRLLMDPVRIYVEIAPKTGVYLSQSQTLGVIESLFTSKSPVSFSYILIKEEGKTGIAIGTLVLIEAGRNVPHKTSFGFQKDNKGGWTLSRIIIR